MSYTSFNTVYRKLDDEQLGGTDNPLYVIANSDTDIPRCAKKFGSTATPSIAGE
jgi:hypothetical protein